MLRLETLLEAVAHLHDEQGRPALALSLRRLSMHLSSTNGGRSRSYPQILGAINHPASTTADRASAEVGQLLRTVGTSWHPESVHELLDSIALCLSEKGFGAS